MKIFIFNKQTDVSLCSRKAKVTTAFILDFLKIKTDEISVYFVSKKKICDLHEEFFNDSSMTDTITLPFDSPSQQEVHHVLGESFICPKAALNFCRDVKKNSHSLYQEITLYLIHSILHLMGFKDIYTKDRKIMKSQEKVVLNEVINNDLLLSHKKSFHSSTHKVK